MKKQPTKKKAERKGKVKAVKAWALASRKTGKIHPMAFPYKGWRARRYGEKWIEVRITPLP